MPMYLAIQNIVCIAAAAYNMYWYFRHIRLMAQLPWAFFCQYGNDIHFDLDDIQKEIAAELEKSGVTAQRVREIEGMWAPYYFGIVWGSIYASALVLALIPTAIILLIILLFSVPDTVGPLAWRYLVGPLIRALLSLTFVLLEFAFVKSVVWPNEDDVPRRPAWLSCFDAASSVLLLSTSPVLGIVRLFRGFIVSLLGLLIVTKPGLQEDVNLALEDLAYYYYICILRQERFNMEVEKKGARIPKLGCRVHAKDFSGLLLRVIVVVAGLLLAHFFLGLLFRLSVEESLDELRALGNR